MADAVLELDVGSIEIGTKLGGPAQIDAGCENAKGCSSAWSYRRHRSSETGQLSPNPPTIAGA